MLNSFRYAVSGILHAIKSERNLRIHLCMMGYVLFFAWFGEVSSRQIPILFVCFGMVLTAELINTAIEQICDLVQPDKHPAVKIIKDIAAGAVLFSAIMAAAAGLWIFLDPAVFLTVIAKFLESPYIPVLLAVSVAFSLLFCKAKKS
ncbi:MAG: diacylglycerol kinase family protein [Oscillospiraceae bacterium]|nr:diacylglycerol kinase family protein [Oscillospiraceae bacterium]